MANKGPDKQPCTTGHGCGGQSVQTREVASDKLRVSPYRRAQRYIAHFLAGPQPGQRTAEWDNMDRRQKTAMCAFLTFLKPFVRVSVAFLMYGGIWTGELKE